MKRRGGGTSAAMLSSACASLSGSPVCRPSWACHQDRCVALCAYFLSGGLPIDVRRTHERQLIAQWDSQLVDNGVGDYSLDDAWEDYRRAVLSVWIIAVVIAGTLDATNERGKRWITEMLARSVAAIDDLDLVTLLDDFV